MPEDVRERLLQAALLGEGAAFGVLIHSNLRRWATADLEHHLMDLRQSQRDLIAASSPEHWQAVATLLREMVELHQTETHTKYNIPVFDEFDSPTSTYRRCTACRHRYYPIDGRREQDGCPTLRLLLPLAELTITDLGPSA